MSIVHPSARPGAALEFERGVIRRFQDQRAGELEGLRGFRRVCKRLQIYWWARDQAIPEILEERRRRRHVL